MSSAPSSRQRPSGGRGPPDLVSLEITLRIIRGRNLVAKDKNLITRKRTSSDPYVTVVLFGKKVHGRTRTISKTLDPEWNETFPVRFGSKYANRIAQSKNLLDPYRTVELRIADEDRIFTQAGSKVCKNTILKPDPMGVVYIPLNPFAPPTTAWYPVRCGPEGSDFFCHNATGELEVSVSAKAVEAARVRQRGNAMGIGASLRQGPTPVPMTSRGPPLPQSRLRPPSPKGIALAAHHAEPVASNQGTPAAVAAREAGARPGLVETAAAAGVAATVVATAAADGVDAGRAEEDGGSSEETETSACGEADAKNDDTVVASASGEAGAKNDEEIITGAEIPLVEKDVDDGANAGQSTQEADSSQPRGRRKPRPCLGVGDSVKAVLKDVPYGGCLVRRQLAGGKTTKRRRLTEAATLYGKATKRYEAAIAGENTDEGKILGHIFAEFEAVQSRLFCVYLENEGTLGPAHESDEEEGEEKSSTTPLRKVLNASTQLLDETEFLYDEEQNKRVRFVFPGRDFQPNSAINDAWVAAVVSVIAHQLAEEVGGRHGEKLPGTTSTELLDLIAWIEHFQDVMDLVDAKLCGSQLRALEKLFANIDVDDKTLRPRLFQPEHDTVTNQDAMDGLAWVYAAVMDLHTRAQDELIMRTRDQTVEWASKSYKIENSALHQGTVGQLFTSLPEDVFTPMSVQLRALSDRLCLSSPVLPALFGVVLSTIRAVHIQEGGKRLIDLEHRCAAANDFERMGEQWEGIVSDVLKECTRLDEGEMMSEKQVAMKQELEAVASELVRTFMADAVRAAKSVMLPIFEAIRSAIEPELFYLKWEVVHTQNELAKTLTATIEDFHHDFESFLGDFLLHKAIYALSSASVVFYVECLLKKARSDDIVASKFTDHARALQQMKGDITVMRTFFEGLVKDMPYLKRKVDAEFELLDALRGILSEAAGLSKTDELTDLVILLHKRIRDVNVTTNFIMDLWNLVAPEEHRRIIVVLPARIRKLLAGVDISAPPPHNNLSTLQLPGLRLDEMVAEVCGTKGHNSDCNLTSVAHGSLISWLK